MDQNLGQEFYRNPLALRDLLDLQRLRIGPMQGKFQKGAARVIGFGGNFHPSTHSSFYSSFAQDDPERSRMGHIGLIITKLIVLVEYRLFSGIVNDSFADGQRFLRFRKAWDIQLTLLSAAIYAKNWPGDKI